MTAADMMPGVDPDALAGAYLHRALGWARRMGNSAPDPGIDWEQVAVDGLLAAIRREATRPEAIRSGHDFGKTLGKLLCRQRSVALRSRRRKPASPLGDAEGWGLVADPRDHAGAATRRVDLADEVAHLMAAVLTPGERRAAAHILAGGSRSGPGNEATNKALTRARKRLAAARR